MTDLPVALARLYARAPLGMRLGIERLEAACARLGHPERSPAVIVQVAGTNGKGSVSAMIASIGREAGMKVGLYTSPHLAELRERVRIDGTPIENPVLVAALERALADPELSFFEAMTLAALLAFRDAGVDLAVLEVGIGGRLDATSVARRSARVAASVLTRVALDHQDRLGATIDAIAREKAAIGVADVPLVLGPLTEEALRAVREISGQTGARLVHALDDEVAGALSRGARLPLPGAHQVQNAHIAAATARVLGIGADAIAAGLARVSWPGRLEWIDGVLLDAAHNPDGAHALAGHVVALDPARRPRTLVFGALADKDAGGMLEILAPIFERRIFVAPAGRAPWHPADLARRWSGGTSPGIAAALATAREGGGPALVTGSIYLVGRARAHLLGLPEDPPVAL